MTHDDNETVTGKRADVVVPVVEEEVVATARPVITGRVRVNKHVESTVQHVEIPVVQEQVEVRRVPVNQVVNEAPTIQERGDIMIIPVVEEELVVTKRFILKEEIHLIRRRTTDVVQKDVEVKSEYADVQRLDAEGRVEDPPSPLPVTNNVPVTATAAPIEKKSSLLGERQSLLRKDRR